MLWRRVPSPPSFLTVSSLDASSYSFSGLWSTENFKELLMFLCSGC